MNLIEYYKNDPYLLTCTIIVMVVCIIAGLMAIFAYKWINIEREQKEVEKKAIEDLCNSSAIPSVDDNIFEEDDNFVYSSETTNEASQESSADKENNLEETDIHIEQQTQEEKL